MDSIMFNKKIGKEFLPVITAMEYMESLPKYKDIKVLVPALGKVLLSKFRSNEAMRSMLLETAPKELVFKNKGHLLGKNNVLGILLMRVRDKLEEDNIGRPKNTEPCPAAATGGTNGCYSGQYWVMDYMSQKLRYLRQCYKCHGKGYLTVESKVDPQTGNKVWSDKERNARYEGTYQEDAPQILHPEDVDDAVNEALKKSDFTV